MAADRAALEDQLAAPEQAIEGKVRQWPELITEETRAWLDAVIEHVTIAPAARRGRVFNAARVEIIWR